MNTTDLKMKAQQLTEYFHNLKDFPEIGGVAEPYGHMGATLSDAALQAGVNYRHTVEPRVRNILARYPEAKTTTAFQAIIQIEGAAQVLDWAEGAKPQRLRDLLHLLSAECLETESDLHRWLHENGNAARIQTIPGVKTKTFQYLRMLCGEPDAVAVDVNLRTFFTLAGVAVSGDQELAVIVRLAAHQLDVAPAALDHALWDWIASSRPSRLRDLPSHQM
jgi:hypothetical protein